MRPARRQKQNKRRQPRRPLRAFDKTLYSAAAARSGELEAIEIHHLVPRSYEVLHELLPRVRASIDFGKRSQLRVRTEDQVDAGAGPLDRLRLAVAALVQAIGASGLPLRAHVEQVEEEVVGQ